MHRMLRKEIVNLGGVESTLQKELYTSSQSARDQQLRTQLWLVVETPYIALHFYNAMLNQACH